MSKLGEGIIEDLQQRVRAIEEQLDALDGCNTEIEAHLATIEKRIVRLEARAESEDEGLAAGVEAAITANPDDGDEDAVPDAQEHCTSPGCAAPRASGHCLYCRPHLQLLGLLREAIQATREAIETAEDPYSWELSLRGLLQSRWDIMGRENELEPPEPAPVATVSGARPPCDHKPTQGVGGAWECYVCGEALELEEPAPVATVGVKCPRCAGEGMVAPVGQPEWNQPRNQCPTCLGAGIVHTDAEFQAVDYARRANQTALENACADIGDGDADVYRYLSEADKELAADEEATA